MQVLLEQLHTIHVLAPAALRGWFLLGACSASLAWFALLGFGSRWLAPLFARPRAWQVLDGVIAVTMFVLSALLLQHVTRDDTVIKKAASGSLFACSGNLSGLC